MSHRKCVTAAVRRVGARVIEGLRAVLSAVRPARAPMLQLMMILTVVAGVSVGASSAQAASETYTPGGTGIARDIHGQYSTAAFGSLAFAAFATPSYVFQDAVFYATFNIPANRQYTSASLNHIFNGGIGNTAQISLIFSQPTIDDSGRMAIRAGTRVASVTTSFIGSAATTGLANAVVVEMNRLSAAGGGVLYLGSFFDDTSGNPYGTFTRFNLVGEYTAEPPTISSISPNSGPTSSGTSVTISGANLNNASSVTFGGVAATSFTASANSITASAPAHAVGVVDVAVTTPGGTATLTNGYTYVAAPMVSSISPNVGPTTGTTEVVITGTNFSTVSLVNFGASSAAITSRTATELRVTRPPNSAGTVSVVVASPGGTTLVTNAYTYVAPPSIIGVVPLRGTTAGGASVSISGSNLALTTGVTFGGVPATNLSTTPTLISMHTPAHAAGAVDVVITTPGGTATAVSGYTYVSPVTISSVSPNSGSTSGGYLATIRGSNLGNATSVTFGGAAATIDLKVSGEIVVRTPAHAAGLVDVVVTAPEGTGTATGAYTFVPPAPTISSVSPNVGPLTGGTTVTLSGTNLNYVTAVTFGGAPATIVGSPSAAAITVSTPSHAAGAVDVVVSGAGGSATATNGFTYLPAPTISGISPNVGPTSGVYSVTVTGTNLGDATSVTFGGVSGAITGRSATQLQVMGPALYTPRTVDVVVTTPGGAATLVNGFTASDKPVATSFTYGSIVPYNAGSATPTTVDLTNNVTNVPTSYTLGSATTAQGGSVVVDSAGQVSYTPPVGYRNANDSFSFTASNVGGTSDPATVTLTIGNPVFTMTLPETTGLIGTTYNTSATPLTISGGQGPYTVISVSGYPRNLSFDSATNVLSGYIAETGNWTVNVYVQDSSTGSGPFASPVSASLITSPAPAPTSSAFTASAVAYNTGAGAATDIELSPHAAGVVTAYTLNNGSGDPTLSTTTAGGGSATIDISSGRVSYTPPVGFRGDDSFQFRPSNPSTFGVWTTVTVPVNDPTFTVTLPASTALIGTPYNPSNAPVTITGGQGPYTITAVTGYPLNLAFDAGTQVLSGQAGQLGSWPINFTITDSSTGTGAFSATVSATLTTSQPPAPTVQAFTAAAVAYNTGSAAATTIDVSAHASGVISNHWLNNGSGGTTRSVATARGGSATIDPATGEVAYTPPVGFRGNDSFQYLVSNSGGGSGFATVTVPVSDPVFTVTLPEITGVLATPYNASNTPITIAGGQGPYTVTAVTGYPRELEFNTGAQVLSGPVAETGSWTVDFTIRDSSTGDGAFTSTVSASLTTTAPDAPTATPFTAPAVAYNTGSAPVTDIETSAQTGGIVTAYGLNNGAGVATLTTTTANGGSATIDASSGRVSYTPPVGFRGDDSFQFRPSNPATPGPWATVTVPVSDPVFTVTLPETTGVQATPFNAANTPISISGGQGPYTVTGVTGYPRELGFDAGTQVLSGLVSETGNWTVAFTIQDSSTGTGGFTSTVSASLVTSPAAAPTANAFTASAVAYNTGSAAATDIELSPHVGGVVTGYTLNNGSGGTTSSITTANGGSATVDADTGRVSYTPPVGFRGSDSFQFRASNPSASGTWTTATVPVSDPVFTVALPETTGRIGVQYNIPNAPVTISGGQGPYTITNVTGYPRELEFNTGTQVLSGWVREDGTFPIVFTITDSSTGDGPATSTASATIATVFPSLPTAASFTAPAVAYNTGSAPVTTIDLTPHGGGVVEDYLLMDGLVSALFVTTAQGGEANIDQVTGQISYTPPVGFRGSDTFQYVTANAGGPAPTATVTVPVNDPVFTVTLPSSTGAVGEVYNNGGQAVTVTGGQAPYSDFSATGLPAGLTISASGIISGTPTTAGSATVLVTATDSSTGATFTGTASAPLVIGVPTITLSPAAGALPDARAGVSYSQTITATGGVAPMLYEITIGALPAGLSLSNGGLIDGTPTETGTFTFTVRATDDSGAAYSGSSAYSLRVTAPGIIVSPSNLPGGGVGIPYSATLSATGGTADYTFALDAGDLPAGLSLTGAGLLSGRPTEGGSFPITVRVTDSTTGGSHSATQDYTLVIDVPTIVINPATLPNGAVGVAVSQTLTATGGLGAYTYQVTAGELPDGVMLSNGGALSGAPTEAGLFAFTVTATDAATHYTGAVAYSWTIGAPTLSIGPASIPTATQYTAYRQTITATGGIPGYTFALRSGDLPNGVTLTDRGLLSGTSTEVGTFEIVVRATDSSTGGAPFSADRTYTLIVGVPAAPTVGDVARTVAANSNGNVVNLDLSGVPADSISIDRAPSHGTATISGWTILYTPSAGYSGEDSFTYRATNQGGDSTPATVTVTVSPPTLALGVLPATATALQTYNGTLTATRGMAPYSFTLDSGELPEGLTLTAAGRLSGQATEAGDFTFAIRATDVNGATGVRSYSLAIAAPAITLTPASLPDGVSANPYRQTLSALGAAAPYAFTVTDGALPRGLTLTPGGVLSGVAGASGTFDFTVTATDRYGFIGERAYKVTVADPVITITSPASGPLPEGVGGTAYRQAFTATGGQGSHQFSLASGQLPPGLTLTPAGLISGIPTAAGTFAFSLTATDGSPAPGPFVSDAVDYSITIVAPTITLTPAAGALPKGMRTVEYSQTFSATGGTPDYSYQVTAGALPEGLTLTPQGALSGNPTRQGDHAFTVTVADTYGFTQSEDYTLEVGTPVAVIQPVTITVLGGQSVTIDASQGAVGLDLIAAQVASAPSHGTATAEGLIITYTADRTYAGEDSFTYTVSNPGGLSAPATVTVTVNPAAIAGPEKTATILAGQTAVVELTEGALGGPFNAAAVASVGPDGAGVATIAARTGPNGAQLYDLSFKPDNSFAGEATVLYTLSNAFSTSAPGKVTITVEARPNPAQDSEVSGLIAAQAATARRFATASISNINRRLERLHDGADGSGFSSSVNFSSRFTNRHRENGMDELLRMQNRLGDEDSLFGNRLENAGLGHRRVDESSAGYAPGQMASAGGARRSPWGVWVSGSAMFGRSDEDRAREGFKFTSDGLTVGADRRVGETTVIGTAISWATDSSEIGDNGTLSDAQGWSVAAYGSWQPMPKTYLDVVLGYGRLDFDSRRFVTATGDFAYGQRDGDQWFGAVTAGSDFRIPQGVRLKPYGRIEASRSVLAAFTEVGGGAYALVYDEQSVETVTGAVGVRGDYTFESRHGAAMPRFRLEYSRDLQGSGTQSIRYADWLDGNVYTLNASPFDRDRMLYGLGMDLVRASGMRLGLDYEGSLSGDQTSSTLRFEFETPF